MGWGINLLHTLQCHLQNKMLPIKQLLFKFRNLTNTEKEKKEVVVNFFKKNGILVGFQQVVISKNTIFIKAPPIIKTEVLLKKEIILTQIRENASLNNILNII